MSFHDYKDTTKFDKADVMLGNVRLTFQAWQDILMMLQEEKGLPRSETFIRKTMDHYNLVNPHTSVGMFEERIRIDLEPEETSPDVFLLNSANAYALYLQTADVCNLECRHWRDIYFLID